MSETLIPAQGPVDVLVGRLRTHAEAHEYIANADPEQKQWMNDLYDAADVIERAPRWRDVADELPQEAQRGVVRPWRQDGAWRMDRRDFLAQQPEDGGCVLDAATFAAQR